MPRLFVIGDIHGCLRALETLVAFAPITDDDQLVTVGDYVDRGPNSCGVLDWLIERHASGNLIPLFGNHEIMMLQARESNSMHRRWLELGGAEALASYGPGARGKLSDVPDSHWNFLEYDTQRYFETDTDFFVHANVRADWPLAEQPDDVLFWHRFGSPPPHQSGKRMICGHTIQRSGRPLDIGHAVCIDTWVYGEGWLTCLDPKTGEYWQANERGETRSDCLESRA